MTKEERHAYSQQWRQENQARNKEYARQYRESHRAEAAAYQKARREADPDRARHYRNVARDELRAMMAEMSCADCGEPDTVVMEWHHISGERDMTVGQARHHGRRRLAEEVAKCVLLCANCHKRRHAAMRKQGVEVESIQ